MIQKRKLYAKAEHPGQAYVPLTQGKVAIIDIADARLVRQQNWCACFSGGRYYARCNSVKPCQLHDFLMHPPVGMEVDHINGNSLDNRRCNLRICSHGENARNPHWAAQRKYRVGSALLTGQRRFSKKP